MFFKRRVKIMANFISLLAKSLGNFLLALGVIGLSITAVNASGPGGGGVSVHCDGSKSINTGCDYKTVAFCGVGVCVPLTSKTCTCVVSPAGGANPCFCLAS